MEITTQVAFTNVTENLINSSVSMWLVPIIIIAGIISNILSLAVMVRQRFRSLSSSVYLMTLAVMDIICLLVDFKTVEWIQNVGNLDTSLTYWHCFMKWWLAAFPYFISSWLIVAVTVERIIIVCLPLKAKMHCTRKKSWTVVIVLIVSMMVIGLTGPLLADIGHRCQPSDENIYTFVIFFSISLYSLLPFLIIAVCNITIVIQLLKQREFMANKMTKTSSKTQTDTQRLTGMLITNSCVFLILTLPYNTTIAYRKLFNKTFGSDTWLTFSHYLVTINHSINFLLYTISGSFYRRELKTMLCGWRRKGYKRGERISLDDHTTHTSI